MQNLKMVCHNLNWSFNTCLLKDWRRHGDREGDTHNIPLGSLCAAQPPILKPTFLRIGGCGDKIWNVPCANSIPGRRSSGQVAWQHTIKSVILEVKWNCMSSIGIGQSLLTQPPFFFGVPKLFVNVIEQQGLRRTFLRQNKPQTPSVCRRFLQLAINAQIPQTLGSDAS